MAVRPKYILPIIIFSQFAGTSLWFAGNVILPEMSKAIGFDPESLGLITMSVQAGFIFGTLIFALISLADRFSPAKIFLISSITGAILNILLTLVSGGLTQVLLLRFLTGFTLAGIYPLGMKIAADWYEKGLGRALGYLVGALVLGTAFPHLLKSFGTSLNWVAMLYTISITTTIGGLLLYFFVGDGPYRRPLKKFDLGLIFSLFRHKEFRASILGYFGHMWELYTFWVFTPVLLAYFVRQNGTPLNISLWSFIIIGAGVGGSIFGGILAEKIGSAKIAFGNLLVSGICILIFPIMATASPAVFLIYMVVWGWSVIGDSPQFSTLAAKTAPSNLIGSGFVIMNCIGFSLTIVSILVFDLMSRSIDLSWVILMLLPGPVVGLLSLRTFRYTNI